MPIYTTYLSYLNKHKDAAEKIGSCFVYYVAVGRGNSEVTPFMKTVQAYKKGEISWDDYKTRYLRIIDTLGREWMKKRAQEAILGNILLVCFEKDATCCHRRLLAEEIAKRFNVEYKGELS